MQNKTPQGNDIPDTTPETELEKYGVWVKAEPQDVIEEPETEHSILGSLPQADEALDSPDDGDAFLTPEQESLLGDMPSLDEDEDMASFGADEDIPTLTADEPEADFLSIDAAGDDASGDDASGDDADIASLDGDALDIGVIDDSVIEIPLDDLDEFEDPVKSASFEPPPRDKERFTAPQANGMETTEISLDDFGFSDESAPAPAKEQARGSQPPSDDSLSSIDLSEFGLGEDSPEARKDAEASQDFDPIDIDLQFDDTIPAPAENASDDESAFSLDEVEELGPQADGLDALAGLDMPADAKSPSMEDVTDSFASGSSPTGRMPGASRAETIQAGVDSFIDDEGDSGGSILPELELEEVTLDGAAKGARAFDDLGALERDLSSGEVARGRVDAASSDLLKTIASELSSIKEELVSLRSQLSEIKRGEAREDAPAADDTATETAAGGFFDDEEDDTIALTGDELDNILNTADFTEESAQDMAEEPKSEELDLLSEPGSAADDDGSLLPEDGEYSLPAMEELGSDDRPLSDDSEAISLEALPDDFAPVTEAPEDTSYLETDDEFGLEAMELEEAPLVEPDLEDLVVEGVNDEIGDDGLSLLEPDTADGLDELVLSIEAPEQAETEQSEADTVLEELEDGIDEFGLEELPSEDGEAELELHAEPAPFRPDVAEMDNSVIKPAAPVSVHPDEISMSLDDSLFVEPDKVLEFSSPSNIAMPDFGSPSGEEAEPLELEEETPIAEQRPQEPPLAATASSKPVSAKLDAPPVPDKLKHDVKSVLLYLDQLLASLPEEKIEEFASSQYYDTYKKLFDELGLL